MKAIVKTLVARHPGLRLLVLFGSRARGEATARPFEAVSYWCDMGPIIREGYDDILTELAR